MKIVYITEFPIPSPAANCVHSLKTCEALAEHGVEVVMLVPQVDQPAEVDWPALLSDFDMSRAYRIIRLPAKMPGDRVYRFAWHCGREVARQKPDVVYTISPICGYFASRAGCEVVYEAHEVVQGRIKSWCLARLMSPRTCRHLVTISEALKLRYTELYGIEQQRILVSHSAGDPIPVAAATASAGAVPVKVGYAGSLGESEAAGRGVDIIIQLAAALPELEFHLLGGRPGEVRFWRQRAQSPNISFHGHMTFTALKERLRDMDILLAPYQGQVYISGGANTASYMSPMKVFEYMAQGKAMVASDLPVLREVLRHEENALLCPPQDVGAWCDAVKQLSEDESFRSRLGATALQDFQANYTWSIRGRRILEHVADSA